VLHSFQDYLETIDGLETEYVKLLSYDLPASFSDHYRSHAYTRLCTILSGEKKVTLNKSDSFTYGTSQHLLLPPHSQVLMEIDQPTHALVFELNQEVIQRVIQRTRLADTVCETLSISSFKSYALGFNRLEINSEIQQLHAISGSSNPNKAFLMDLSVQKLVYELIKDCAARSILQMQYPARLQEIIHYIDAHLHEHITLEEIAKDCHMSPSNLSHLFKKYTTLRPMAFIRARKMALAATYLQHHSVTEVALMLGYDNLSHFIRLFREHYQETPKQYQLRHQPALK